MEADARLIRRAVDAIIREVTNNANLIGGLNALADSRHIKQIKGLVRADDTLIAAFVDHLFKNLKRESAKELLLLTLELDPLRCPMPGPQHRATDLKLEAMHTIRSWIDKYGAGYASLANVSHFLSASKQLDFQAGSTANLAERKKMEMEREKAKQRAKMLEEKIAGELQGTLEDMERVLLECRSAIQLVYPKFIELNAATSSIEVNSTTVEQNTTGATSSAALEADSTVQLSLYSSEKLLVEWGEENIDLLNSLQDSRTLLAGYMRRVKKWIKELSPSAALSTPTTKRENRGEMGECSTPLIRQLIDLKASIAHELTRCDLLKVEERRPSCPISSMSGDNSSDEEEDVHWVDADESEVSKIPLGSLQYSTEEAMLSASAPCLTVNSEESSNKLAKTPGGEMVPSIPVVPFGLDLKYWGCEKLTHPQRVLRHQLDSHPFWRPPDDDSDEVTGTSAGQREQLQAYTTRLITFVGQRPVSTRMCRAMLRRDKDGRAVLCPRRDFYSCPLHGKLVERDDDGVALSEEHRRLDEQREMRKQAREAEALRKDIEAATGCVLGDNVTRSGGAERRESNARKAAKTILRREKKQREVQKVRDRLEAKLFDPRTMRRVGGAIERVNEARVKERFHHQFSHM